MYTDAQSYQVNGASAALTDLQNVEPSLAQGPTYTVSSTSSTWTTTVTSKTGDTFTIAKAADGTVTHNCTSSSPGKFGCPDTSYVVSGG
jgi:hypothetical protein